MNSLELFAKTASGSAVLLVADPAPLLREPSDTPQGGVTHRPHRLDEGYRDQLHVEDVLQVGLSLMTCCVRSQGDAMLNMLDEKIYFTKGA